MRASFSIGSIGQSQTFPLKIDVGGRFLTDQAGNPFFIHGQSLWEIEVQPTRAQIDQILDLLKTQGFNAIIFEPFEHLFSNQSPPYLNVEGNAPFTSISGSSPPYAVDFSTANATYWNFDQYVVNGCLQRGIVCFICLTYYGFAGSQEGWSAELTADTQAHRNSFGVSLMNLLGKFPNVVWVGGGDNISGASLYDDIITGMRTVRTDQIITYHASRGNDGYSVFNGHTGFNLNSQYSNNAGIVGDAATCYGRSGPFPFVLLENEYENASGQTNQTQRCQAYQSLLGGAAGHFFGCDPYWSLGQDGALGGISVATAITNYGSTTATLHQAYVKQLWLAYNWQKLVPQAAISGSGVTAIVWALASGGTFAFFYTPAGVAFAVTMSNITHGSVRARWYDPTNGTFATDAASPLANTGSHTFTPPGNNAAGDADLLLVLD